MMNTEYARCLEEELPSRDGNSLKVLVMGYPAVGKKTFVAALRNEWSEIRNKKTRRGEIVDDLGIKGRGLVVEVVETNTKRQSLLQFVHRLPSCDVFVLVYSMVCEDSYKSVCAARENILQQKGYSIPIIFAANKRDIADGIDKNERVYRDLNISCEWEHGHYEISAHNVMDVNKVLEQMMKRVNRNVSEDEEAGACDVTRFDRCKRFFSNMLQ